MKIITHVLMSILLVTFFLIVTIPLWKDYFFVNEKQLPNTINALKSMKLVNGGTYTMGDATKKIADATPTQLVKLSTFYMDETPVTVEDFEKYIQGGGTTPRYWNHQDFQKKNLPVIGVSWSMAVDYCNWRSKVEGLEPAYQLTNEKDKWGNEIWYLDLKKNGYRLPTEAEFEYAARGGLENVSFPWGEKFDEKLANYDDKRGKYNKGITALVGIESQKVNTNDYGLKGMSGNIWHWCNDWYEDNYSKNSSGKNPVGPRKGTSKVLRGGSWGSIDPEQLTVYYRNKAAIGSYNYDIGFRCVRPVKVGIYETLNKENFNENVAYTFFKEKIKKDTEINTALGDEDFKNLLVNYIENNFSHSLYFQERVAQQNVITPEQLATIIINQSLEYNVNPVFLTGIMIAETGMGTVSSARWQNNPLAFNWNESGTKAKTSVLASNQSNSNGQYLNLESCFGDFLAHITSNRVKNEAYTGFNRYSRTIYKEHKPYLMPTISDVYQDLLSVYLSEDFLSEDIGRFIYTDWGLNDGKNNITPKSAKREKTPLLAQAFEKANSRLVKSNNKPRIDNERDGNSKGSKQSSKALYYLIVKQNLDMETAATMAKKLRSNGFPHAGVIRHNKKNAIAIRGFKSKASALAAFNSMSEHLSDIEIVNFSN